MPEGTSSARTAEEKECLAVALKPQPGEFLLNSKLSMV